MQKETGKKGGPQNGKKNQEKEGEES